MAEDSDVLDHMALEDDRFVYEVVPEGPVQRRDIVHFEKACRALDREPEEAVWRPLVEKAARAYWSGRASSDPLWEFLAREATIAPTPDNERVNASPEAFSAFAAGRLPTP